MRVVEIFNSIEGEGKRAGIPCTFIRLQGCNLNCTYCDSQYACSGDATVMTIDEILDKVREFGCNNITVTGGEPLIHPGINELLRALMLDRYSINVETNGSIVPTGTFPYNAAGNLFYTMDYKTFSSGQSDKMNPEAFKKLDCSDVLKFVVGDEKDLDQALEFLETNECEARVFVSPIFGKIEAKEIVEYIQKHKLWHWSVQLQLHKYIWDPDKKGV